MDVLLKVFSFEPFWTVVCGVIVFLLCEYAKNTWFESLQKYRQMRETISYLLCMHANKYTNPLDLAEHNNTLPEEYAIASNDFREIASKLRAFIEVLPRIHIGIPNKNSLYEASVQLIGLSNCFTLPYGYTNRPSYKLQDNEEFADRVRSLLGIYSNRTRK